MAKEEFNLHPDDDTEDKNNLASEEGEEEDDDEDELDDEEDAYDTDDSDDPVVNEFAVYWTPPSDNELYVMSFIGMEKDKALTGSNAPTEIRLKPESGYVEVDIPLNIHNNYDRLKGIKFGEALRKTKGFGQTAYGAAAGFERAMPRSTKRPGAAAAEDADGEEEEEADQAPPPIVADENLDEYLNNFDDANEKGHVLNTVTWGGQIVGRDSWKPNYCIGVFRGQELHLTPIAGIIQLRPEFHHLDAVSHLEAASKRKEATNAKDILPPTKKSTTDEPTCADLLKGAANEKWVKLRWVPSDDIAAYEWRNKRLFLPDASNAKQIPMEPPEDYYNRILPVRVGKKPDVHPFISKMEKNKKKIEKQRAAKRMAKEAEANNNGIVSS